MMDCDTTGVEPDFSLVKSKKLVGGGEITIVNRTVPMALDKLGYSPDESAEVARTSRRRTCRRRAVRQDRPLPGLRLRDRRARDPLHGPREDDGRDAALHLRRDLEDREPAGAGDGRGGCRLLQRLVALGVKAIAIYRDNCKVAQPLSGKSDKAEATPLGISPAALMAGKPQRRRSPLDRTEVGRKFQVGDYEGYIHVGLYEDGTPGDIFVDIAKDGTTLQGLMNSLMIAVSMGLQYGVPPEVYVSKLSHMRFEPSGMTNDEDIASRSRSSTTSSAGSARSS